MNVKQRLISFDLLKLFAIYLVLWGHCIQYLSDDESFDNQIFISIYSFHMPLFMVISGFFARKSLMNKNFREIMKNKCMELIVPCISVGVLLFLLNPIKNVLLNNLPVIDFFELFDEVIIKDLWFLKSLFCCYLLAITAYINKRHLYLKLSCTILISFFLNFYMLKRVYLFFILGILLNHKFEDFKKHAKVICTCSLILFILLLTGYDKNIYLTDIGDVKDALMGGNINEFFITISQYIYNILTSLLGCTTFISLFYLGNNKFSHSILRHLSKFGQFTLGIYIMQYIILERNLPLFIKFEHINALTFNYLIVPFLSVILLAICYFLTRLVGQNKTAAFLLLGKHS